MSHHSSNFSRSRGRSRDNWHPNSNRYTHQNMGQSAADQWPNNWQQSRYNSGVGQWSGHKHVRCQLCSNFGHTTPYCPHFCSSTQQPSTHLNVGNVSAATWFPDTDVNQHITPDFTTLTDSAPYLDNNYLHFGDSKGLDISHIGHTRLHSPKNIFILSNVLHVLHIIKPLLSPEMTETFHTNSKNETKRNNFHLILNLGPFRIFQLNFGRNKINNLSLCLKGVLLLKKSYHTSLCVLVVFHNFFPNNPC
jgi:hypothetical protein